MNPSPQPAPLAWQPLTPRGVAAFARTRAWNLLAIQLCMALLAAVTVVGFFRSAWFPVIRPAISQMPDSGQIRFGRLQWTGRSPVTLAENHFLAITVDLSHQGQARSPAHIQAEFGQSDCKLFSLLGFWQYPYPRAWIVAFDRPELSPWWDAWAPALLAIAGIGTVLALLLAWTLLATLYFLPAWLAAFFANRDLNLAGSWRLSGAALMPGAALLVIATLFYGAGALDLVRLAFAAAVHFVLAWIYVAFAIFFLPRHPEVNPTKANPFTTTAGSG